jgi:histidinol-phosphate aminotransferase
MGTERLKQTLRQDVQGMHAYAIQPSAGFIKLDAMENPFMLPPHLQHALGERLGCAAINRYPAQRVADLAAALTAHVQLPAGQRLMLGNGSDELIDLLAVACDVPGATILAPVPGFVMYAMSAQLRGLNFVGVPLTASFQLDEAAMLAAIEQPGHHLHRLPEQPHGQPLRRRCHREDRRGHRPAERPGGVRRGLPALQRAHLAAAHG